MQRFLIFPVRTLVFWYTLFFVYRVLFLISNGKYIEGDFLHQASGLFAGFRLDISTASYISAFPVLLWIISLFFSKKRGLYSLIIGFHWIIVPLVILVLLGNLGLYASWETLMNKRVLLYLKNPGEMMNFMSTWMVIVLPIALTGLSYLVMRIYKRWVAQTIFNATPFYGLHLLWIPLWVLLIRGGLQITPISESSATYSKYSGNNHLAINPFFYMMHSASEFFYLQPKYLFYPEEEALKNFNEFLDKRPENKLDSLIISDTPNIVFIILESWTADLIAPISELKDVAPFASSLAESSLLFSNAYSSGYRTDQGLVSILSGYPSQPDNSIISYPSKTEKLTALSDILKQQGYSTSFYYGGNIEFANMKSYLSQHSFDKIIDQSNFPGDQHNSKWGAHDGFVFDRMKEDMTSEKSPFLSCILTLSTHEPFEVPMQTPFDNNQDENEKFKKSAWYTDQCLKSFFEDAKNQNWYNNTLFVLVADHGHHHPLGRNMNYPESRRITLMLHGNVLNEKYKGQIWDKYFAQHDIAATLADALKMDKSQFPWSFSLLDGHPGFAYYGNENGFGFLADSSKYVYYFQNQLPEGDPGLETTAKSYLQLIYQDFIDR